MTWHQTGDEARRDVQIARVCVRVVRMLRKRRGMTQADAAAAAGVHVARVRAVEAPEGDPQLATWLSLARLHGWDLSTLLAAVDAAIGDADLSAGELVRVAHDVAWSIEIRTPDPEPIRVGAPDGAGLTCPACGDTMIVHRGIAGPVALCVPCEVRR